MIHCRKRLFVRPHLKWNAEDFKKWIYSKCFKELSCQFRFHMRYYKTLMFSQSKSCVHSLTKNTNCTVKQQFDKFYFWPQFSLCVCQINHSSDLWQTGKSLVHDWKKCHRTTVQPMDSRSWDTPTQHPKYLKCLKSLSTSFA